MMEVTNVLKGTCGLASLASVTKLKHTLAKKDDQEGDEAANRDWGVSVAEEADIPPDLKSAMMEVVLLSVNEVQRLATEDSDEGFFNKIFINRMCSTDGSQQQRQIDSPQHLWHTDGNGEPLLAVVLTLLNLELDSDLISSRDAGGFVKVSNFDAGGFVKVSNFDDACFTPTDSSGHNHPIPSATTTCYPPTNSLCVFPGYFVAHAVFKVRPGAVRYSVVMFITLCDTLLIEGVTPDTYLRCNGPPAIRQARRQSAPGAGVHSTRKGIYTITKSVLEPA
jgi:hypothetical protein